MMNFGYEDFVANALIEKETRTGVRSVKVSEVNLYKQAVIKEINEQGISVCVIGFLKEIKQNYSDYFYIHKEKDETYILTKEGISIKDLWKKFRNHLSTNVFLIFHDEEILKSLNINSDDELKLKKLI